MIGQCLSPAVGMLVLFIALEAPGPAPAPAAGQTTTPALRERNGDEQRRAEELNKAVETAAGLAREWGAVLHTVTGYRSSAPGMGRSWIPGASPKLRTANARMFPPPWYRLAEMAGQEVACG